MMYVSNDLTVHVGRARAASLSAPAPLLPLSGSWAQPEAERKDAGRWTLGQGNPQHRGLRRLREELAAPAGAPETVFAVRHEGVGSSRRTIVTATWGAERVRVELKEGSGLVKVGGKLSVMSAEAELWEDSVYVPPGLASLVAQAAAQGRPNRLQLTRPEPSVRVADRYGLRWSAMDGASAAGLAYRAPDGLMTNLVDAFSERAR